MKIYVASSWRNSYQPGVVEFLRRMGHDVYDFKNPIEGDHGFHWTAIDPNWNGWDRRGYIEALKNPTAEAGFAKDMDALKACDACVVVGPCGRSAHLEFGWAVGAGRKSVVYLPEEQEPELMYKMADAIVTELHHVQLALFGGHSMGRYLPCPACGDLDGCHKWREDGNQYDSRKNQTMAEAGRSL
jgi:hypothetical protein